MKSAPNLGKTFFCTFALLTCNRLFIKFLFKNFLSKNKSAFGFVIQIVIILLYLQLSFWDLF